MTTYEVLSEANHDYIDLEEYRLRIGALEVGAGTAFGLSSLTGLRDLPDVRNDDQPRASDHGEISGKDYLGGRPITFELLISRDTIHEVEDDLRAIGVMWPLGVDLAISVQTSRRWSCVGRLRRRSAPMTFAGEANAYARAAFEFRCADPFLYGQEQGGSLNAAPAVGGRTYPRTYNLTYPLAASPGLEVLNFGSMPTDWVATLVGPLTDPVIELETTGEKLAFVGEVLAGQTLVVSSRDRTVLLDGSSRYQWLTPVSRWFRLPPNYSKVTFRATGAGSMSLLWRSATA